METDAELMPKLCPALQDLKLLECEKIVDSDKSHSFLQPETGNEQHCGMSRRHSGSEHQPQGISAAA